MPEKSFLYVSVDRYGLLLDVAGVHEVLEMSEAETAALGANSYHQNWRGMIVQSVSARQLLGLESNAEPAKIGIIYNGTDEWRPIMLEVDRVICLRHLAAKDFLAIPKAPEAVHKLFDGVFVDHARECQVYRLRRPLALDLPVYQ